MDVEGRIGDGVEGKKDGGKKATKETVGEGERG